MNNQLIFWLPLTVTGLSLAINFWQFFNRRRIRNKIVVWAKDAKGMINSIIGVQKNIKNKKITSLGGVSSNLETLANFSNSMFLSLEEELGNKKREITIKKKKKSNK